MHGDFYKNYYFLFGLFILFLLTIFTKRVVHPYYFIAALVIAHYIQNYNIEKYKEIDKNENIFKEWVVQFPYKGKEVLLLYGELINGLYEISKFSGKNTLFYKSIYFWINFCDDHNDFIQKRTKVDIAFVENFFDFQRTAMNYLLLIGTKIKDKNKLKIFHTESQKINKYTRSLLSEVVSNSNSRADQFDVYPINSNFEKYDDNWKML